MNDDAVERVSHAMWDAYTDCEPTFPQWDQVGEREQSRFRYQATAAITAHNAWLRERAQDADVVEAVRGRMLLWPLAEEDCNAIATDGITAALDAMIGKEQDDER